MSALEMFMNDPVQGFVGRGACISFSRRRWRAFPPHSSVPESRSLRRAYAVVPARWRLAGGRGGGFLCGAPSTWLHPRPAFLPMSCDSPLPPARPPACLRSAPHPRRQHLPRITSFPPRLRLASRKGGWGGGGGGGMLSCAFYWA